MLLPALGSHAASSRHLSWRDDLFCDLAVILSPPGLMSGSNVEVYLPYYAYSGSGNSKNWSRISFLALKSFGEGRQFSSSCRKSTLDFFPFAFFSVFLTARITTVTLKYFLVQCQCFKRRDTVPSAHGPPYESLRLPSHHLPSGIRGPDRDNGPLPLSPLDFTGIKF